MKSSQGHGYSSYGWQSWGMNPIKPDSKSYTLNIYTVSLFKLLLLLRMSLLSLPVKTLPCLQHHNTLHLGLSHSDNNNWYSPFIWEAWKGTSQCSFARNLTGPGVLIPWEAVHIPWEAQIKEGLSKAKWGLGISWISKTLFEKTQPYPVSLQSESSAPGKGISNKYSQIILMYNKFWEPVI